MTAPGLHFNAWHPLLVRALHSLLEERANGAKGGVRLGSLLAILTRLPIPEESLTSIDLVLPSFRAYILSVSLRDALCSASNVSNHFVDYSTGIDRSGFLRCHRKRSKRTSLRSSRTRRAEAVDPTESDSDKPFFHRLKVVHVHERVLLSDSDGFAPWMGNDAPSAGDEVLRGRIDDNCLFSIYRSLFGVFPTLISDFDCLMNAVLLFSRFAERSSIPTGVTTLCDFFNSSCILMDTSEDSLASRDSFSQWISWQALLQKTCDSLAFLATTGRDIVGYNFEGALQCVTGLLLDQFGRNVCASLKMNSFLRGGEQFDEMHLICVDDAMNATHMVTVRLFEDLISLVAASKDKSALSRIGEYVISWTEDPQFLQIIPRVIGIVECKLGIKSESPHSRHVRFVFELFASLVDLSCLSLTMLHWSLTIPMGFKKSATGLELLSALSGHVLNYPEECALVLKRHLSVMVWSTPTRVSSFSGVLAKDTIPSNTVVRFTQDVLSHLGQNMLIRLSSIILDYCDPFDSEFLLMNAVVPSIETSCRRNCDGRDFDRLFAEMPEEMVGTLKGLELLGTHLRTKEASSDVIRKIVCPFRDFYFSESELQDVFIGVCSKAVRNSPTVAFDSGLCEWMVDRLTSLHQASTDIWLFVQDSAAKFSKLLISMLTLIGEIIEEGSGIFSTLAPKLSTSTSNLVDVCFEWIRNPVAEYRNIVRISEIVSKALSIHLLLSDDMNDVIARFTSALLRSFGFNPPEVLVSVLLCTLLDQCISRLPPSMGSLWSIDHDSEDDVLMGEGGPLTAGVPTRRILHPQLIPAAIIILTSVIKLKSKIGREIEYLVGVICSRLRVIDTYCEDGARWMPQLFPLCSELVRVQASPSTVAIVLRLIVAFIKRGPRSKDIHDLISYFHRCSEYKEVILSCVDSLLNWDRLEPPVSLLFPQDLMPNVVEIKNPAHEEAFSAQFHYEEMTLTADCSRLHTVDKFLTNRSDGETENERRREKKKHLREHVRGRSMVSMDRFTEEVPESTNCSNANEAAAFFPLTDLNFIAATDGLTLSFWLKRKLLSKAMTLMLPLHIVSLGGELSCSCWMSCKGRLTVEIGVGDIRFSKFRLKGIVKDGFWTHITFGFRLEGKSVLIQASVGDSFTNKIIPCLVKLSTPSFAINVSLGSIQRRIRHHYQLSTIFGLKGLMPPNCVLVLRALGPRLNSLTETSVDHLVPNMVFISTPRLIASSQHTIEMIRLDPAKQVQKVQRAVVFVIRASSAHSFGVSVLPPDIEPSNLLGQSALSMARLKFYPINWRGTLIQEKKVSPNDKMPAIGGIRFILYLYAKSVNDGLSPGVQLRALRLMLSSVQRGCLYLTEAAPIHLDSVLARIFSSPLAVVDQTAVNILLKFCVNCTEVESSQDDGPSLPQLDFFEAVVREPKLLVSLCCRSEIWRADRFSCWRRIVHSIRLIMDPDVCRGPHKFNRNQLANADMLLKFLHCIQEMIQDPANFPAFDEEEAFASDIRAIVHNLLGSPESPATVSQLWHFIFLSHPPSHTYIDHRVQGHNSWIQPSCFKDECEGEIIGDSLLSRRLTKYSNLMGKDFISTSWVSGLTPYEMRRRFLQASDYNGEDDSFSEPLASTSSEDSVLDQSTTSPRRMTEASSDHRWVVCLRATLMDLLATVLQNGADSLLSCLQHDVISWHAIVILMSHQNDPNIRDAVADMLQKFLLRCPPYTKIAFLRLQGFEILATQLRAFPPTPAIADFLFSLMCGETIRLGDGLDQAHLTSMAVDRVSCESIHAILVVFEGSVADAPLFWNICNALLKTFENNSQLQQAMIDFGLVDAMVSTLRRIAYLPPTEECEVVMDRQYSSLQVECWSSFAQRILISSVPYSDQILGSACERFIWLLVLADVQAGKDLRYPEDIRLSAHKVIRSQLCQLLHCWIESIRTVFSEEGRSASATSSVDSLYNKGDGASTSSSPSSDPDYDYCDDVITPERANLLDGTSPVAAFLTGSFANLRERISNMGPISKANLKCKYKRRVGPAPLASMDKLTERLNFAMEINSNVFCALMPTVDPTENEENLFHFFLYFMLSSWKKEIARSGQTVWNRLICLCRDKVRFILAQLVAFILFPAHRKLYQLALASKDIAQFPNWKTEWIEEKRRQIVRALSHELQYRQSLSSLLNVNLDYEYALCLGLYDMAFVADLKDNFEEDLSKMMRFLCSGKVGTSLDQFTPEAVSDLTTNEILSLHSYSQHRKSVFAQLRSKMESYREEEGKLTAEIGGVAMEVTREVVEQLNLPRKVFMRVTKQGIGEFVDAENILHSISKEVCHVDGPCFEARHWPVGWALDPTEGPLGERRKLMPYNYPFEKKFFAKERQTEMGRIVEEEPLQNLMGTPISMRAIQESGQMDEHIRLFVDATILRGTFECQGELHVGKTRLYFVGEKAQSTQKGTCCSAITLSWSLDQLEEIQMRNHLLKAVALEIFLSNGETYLIVFQSTDKREQFVQLLSSSGLQRLFPNTDQVVQTVLQAWRHGSLSNFEYLMHLNKLAGRSYSDLMQYPVFPFILADYTSTVVDLSNPASYRNLAKPMAIQDKRMEEHYTTNYALLQEECRSMERAPQHFGPYHYGSHYSNSGVVAHYLVRLSPYTQIALEYQDHSFDIPDRLFNSIEATWRLSSCDSTTDFKELIPEFFYLSEFLVNRDQLELGIRQAGERVGAVKLPNWAPEGNPRLFTLVHRQALESVAVTANLNSWVDLIFGFKQTGKAALDAINVFHPATYAGELNADELKDEVSASALRTMIRSYGQMPIQIIKTPHQPHLLAGKDKKERERIPGPLASVVGLRWGDFVGSPEQDASKISVTLSLRLLKSDRLAYLLPLLDDSVVGVPRDTVLLYTSLLENPSDYLCKSRIQSSLSAMSWSFSDAVLRFRTISPALRPWTNIMDLHDAKISNIAYSSTNQLLFVAFTSGLVRVFRLSMDEKGIQSISAEADFLAHKTMVECLSVCDEYSIVVSGDADGKVILWDINRLTFVRVLRKPSCSVTAICISATTADVAVVCQPQQSYGSRVELYTVNGGMVGTVNTENPVICIAMTNQAEGTGINCMALGMQDGHIRLVEMWCLTVVRDIWHEGYKEPIVSVAFSGHGRKMFALLASGRLLCWQNVSSLSKTKPQFAIVNPHEMSS